MTKSTYKYMHVLMKPMHCGHHILMKPIHCAQEIYKSQFPETPWESTSLYTCTSY